MNHEEKNSNSEYSHEEIISQLKQELAVKNRALEIEFALEHVRVRTLNMRNSSELSETSALLFQQLDQLRIKTIRTGVGIFDDANEAIEIWVTSKSENQEVLQILDYFSLHIHPAFENLITARSQKKSFALTILKGSQVKDYYQTMSTYLRQGEDPVFREQEFFYSFFFSQGALNIITDHTLTEEECDVLKRFAQVFGLIYTRFFDLQKAEAQTIEAERQSSLERVRAEIASMRSTSDLSHITLLIWKELIKLDVPFIEMDVPFLRCGVFIVSEEEKVVHAYLSTPDGESLGVLHLPFDEGLETASNIVRYWRENKTYSTHWTKEEFDAWVNEMVEKGQISEPEKFRKANGPVQTLYLHFSPFIQGMLYVGSGYPLYDNQKNTLKALADSFSVAYARYQDFQQLDEAKNKVENALKDLKATQAQLIQSEKMASLGELTAGIAHEIQNPLNFVNNFSELNKELLEELNEEIEKENFEGVKAIAKDIIGNQEKVSLHGKRAEGIVKGMLQHSRTSSGKKELSDINALCDEYLRISYHGLRAKDKSFNAKFETNFDSALPKIKVVSQDIGRVMLNLINNAFYAVNEKMKGLSSNPTGFKNLSGLPGFEPTVIITTKQETGKILITVKDNGNGIPDSIQEKIFQPFFTTKPTGQGTGLGLSLSYDIIKAHGGEIRAESTIGVGSTFIIQLPQM
jgi:signal transduction histidine kinase